MMMKKKKMQATTTEEKSSTLSKPKMAYLKFTSHPEKKISSA